MKVQKNEFFPADLVMLASSEPKNLCFVETKNLDGETNLKHKSAPKGVKEFNDAEEVALQYEGEVICEVPNDQIYKYEGVIKTVNGTKISLSSDNLLLSGDALHAASPTAELLHLVRDLGLGWAAARDSVLAGLAAAFSPSVTPQFVQSVAARLV